MPQGVPLYTLGCAETRPRTSRVFHSPSPLSTGFHPARSRIDRAKSRRGHGGRRSPAQRTFALGSASCRQRTIRGKEIIPGSDFHNLRERPRRAGSLVHKSGARANDLPEESKNPEGNGRPSHSFRPSLRRSASGGRRFRATYSNVLAGCVSAEKLEAHRDAAAIRVAAARILANRQFQFLPSLSQNRGGCSRRAAAKLHLV